jgi:hypothetical protein
VRTSRLINQRSSRSPAVCGRPRSRPPPRVAAAASPQRQARRTPRDRTFALFASLHRESSVDRTRRTRDARPASATPAVHRAGHARPPQLSSFQPSAVASMSSWADDANDLPPPPSGGGGGGGAPAGCVIIASSLFARIRGVALRSRRASPRLPAESRGIDRSRDRRDDATTDGARKAAPFPRASPLRTSSLTALLLDRSPPSQR